jgi:hypothetical protein
MNDNFGFHPDAIRADQLVELILPILAGETPEAQGATLAHLLAQFIAGHAPPLREGSLIALIECVERLVPVIVEEMIDDGRVPPDWREWREQ